MKNLNDLKYDHSFNSFKRSDFYSSLYNPYYILHKDYLGAYLRTTKQTTDIDYENCINIEINPELHNIKEIKVIYLPFIWEKSPLILWIL